MLKTIAAFFLLIAGFTLQAQIYPRRQEYIEQYSELAMEEMIRSGVPASITLAQAVLESGDGASSLAKRSNNHFGIKCHEWNGKTTNQDDDQSGECFRSYKNVEDSYRDHSDFLKTRQRYAFLFDLDPTNYKGWAKGLKQAGYATSPEYANMLIRIIEDYDLERYDLMALNEEKGGKATGPAIASSGRHILEKNRVKYIIAGEGDTYESLTAELGKMQWELPKYNEVSAGGELHQGQIVYLQPKRNKANVDKKTHTVKEGETMHSISQLYAVKVEKLYYLNRMTVGDEPKTGIVLQLRKPLKGMPETPGQVAGESPEDDTELIFDIDL
jgi:LysM repeat protein